MSEQIAVELGPRSYNIHIGRNLLARAGSLIAPFARGVTPVVTDGNVAHLHLDQTLESLRAAGLTVSSIVIAPGEQTKNFSGLESLCSILLGSGVERKGLIVALGGGVVGDLVGFAAGILKRGVSFAQIPTTLLSQVDSSVGGKTGINTAAGKNLIGVFHQPRIVIADIDTLRTLPRRELLSGYAEVAKYGAFGDAEFFEWLEANAAMALEGQEAALTRMVAHSCRIKADIVKRDERETGVRELLNFGHTFGHALEASTGYSTRLLHGEGVAIGMVLALRLSVRLGCAPQADCDRIEKHLRLMGLPVAIADIPGPRPEVETLLSHMAHDKKAKDGLPTFILVRALGHAFPTNEVPRNALRQVLAS